MSRLNTKRNSIFAFILLIQSLLLSPTVVFGQKQQSRKYLESKKKELQKEIEYTNQLLDETKKNKRNSLNQLVTLNKKISVREELIYTINGELSLLNQQIKKNNKTISELQKELDKLKAEYSRMIYYAYKNQNAYSRLMFIFASSDFEQAFMRLKYLQQYSEYRHKQAEMIVKTKNTLDEQTIILEAKKSEQRSLLTNEQTEKEKLSSEKKEKEQVVVQLQTKESELKKELQKKKKDAEKFEQAILRIIQMELEKAQKEAEDDNKPKPQKLGLTPEGMELSNSFSSNKNKLPWPVEKGFISERFGVHPHPLIPNIEINNNGVDITTSNGALARAVFDGEVKAIVTMPGAGRFVLIRHGEYLTIYSNLKDVYIKVGDKVKTKQKIASIMVDEKDANTVLHFELWKGQTKQNPESWLFSSN
jgi:septal ring factor EnvC (AmiA/AmiB activator)